MQSIGYQIGLASVPDRLGKVLRAHLWYIAVVAVYFLAALCISRYFSVSNGVSLFIYVPVVPMVTGIYVFCFALLYLVYVMIAVRPVRLFGYLTADIGANWLTAERLFGGLLITFLMQAFFSVFTSMKSLIPVINPFAWDAALAEWDRVLHGGIDPWLLLQPLLGFPVVTSAINFFYQCWLFVLYGFLVWQGFSLRDQRLRMQFFLTLMLVWVLLGNVMATMLSSAGPVYFGRITGLYDVFLPLMEYLRAANETYPVWALELQDRLWNAYALDDSQLGKGISAMPSIHVATSVLFALVAWRAHRLAGIVFSAYAVIVMIGSVHLAWHYALDGYVAALLTWLLWHAAGRLVVHGKVLESPYTKGR